MASTENAWPTWVDWILDLTERSVYVMIELVSMMFGGNADASKASEPAESMVEKILFFTQNVIGTLSFDHFQLLLLKIFVLILISTGILICATWHIYGQRITERFMHPGRETRPPSPCSFK